MVAEKRKLRYYVGCRKIHFHYLWPKKGKIYTNGLEYSFLKYKDRIKHKTEFLCFCFLFVSFLQSQNG